MRLLTLALVLTASIASAQPSTQPLPTSADVEYLGSTKDQKGNTRAGFSATTVINRKDFGVTYNTLIEGGGTVLGDDVTVLLDISSVKKD